MNFHLFIYILPCSKKHLTASYRDTFTMQDSTDWKWMSKMKQREEMGRAGSRELERSQCAGISSSQNTRLYLKGIIDHVNSIAKCMKWCVYVSVCLRLCVKREGGEKREPGGGRAERSITKSYSDVLFPFMKINRLFKVTASVEK